MTSNDNLYRWVKASERLPVIDNKNPKHYVFLNDVNHNAINIWTEFIRDFPPMILVNKLDWQWLEKIEADQQEKEAEYNKGYADGYNDATKEARKEIHEHYRPNNE